MCESLLVSTNHQPTKNMNTTNRQAAERTAKYFGISIEKATEMLAAADKMNAQLQAKGESLAQRVKEGKQIPYVTR